MSRAVKELRPPGVYPAAEEPRARPLSIAETSITGFVGLAEKGPLDEPRLISGWSEFVATYGQLRPGYLSRAVEGFFLNGGASCYVVRIAYRPRQAETPGPAHPASAGLVVTDEWDKPTLRVRAESEGKWGNGIWVRFEQ